MTEDSGTEAKEARDRCLEAMIASDEIETRVSLWRAALRYNQRDKVGRESGDYALPSPRAVGVGARARDEVPW